MSADRWKDFWKLHDGLCAITKDEFVELWRKHSDDEYYLRESAWPRFSQDRLGFVRRWNDGKEPRLADQICALAEEKARAS